MRHEQRGDREAARLRVRQRLVAPLRREGAELHELLRAEAELVGELRVDVRQRRGLVERGARQRTASGIGFLRPIAAAFITLP